MAAPFVAGQAALLATFTESGGIEIKDRIRESARQIDTQNPNYVNRLGKGRIDIYASMTVFGTPPPTSTPTATATPQATATPTATSTPTATATPTATPDGTVVSPEGGTLSATGPSTEFKLTIPTGAVTETVKIFVEPVAGLNMANMSPVVGEAWHVYAVNMGGQPRSQLAKTANVTITVSPSRFAALNTGDLAVGRWDEAKHIWTPLPFTLDTANRRLTVASDQLGVFAVLADMTERIFLTNVWR